MSVAPNRTVSGAGKFRRFDCCMVTSRHRCDDSRILGLEARSLVAHGFSVAWVGPKKGNCSGHDDVDFRLFDSKSSGVPRLLHLLRGLRATPAQVYHCHEPDAVLVALIAAKPRGAKVVFDAHEFFRAYARGRVPRGLKSLASLAYFFFELIAYRLCDHLITVSEGVADGMAKAIPLEKITVVANCSGPSVFLERARAFPIAGYRVLHLGTASFYHQLREMLEAFLIIREEIPDAEFLQVGLVPNEELEWLRSFERNHGLEGSIRYIPRVPFEELAGYIPCADVGLIARRADENANTSISTKLFDYMTFGVPIVATDLMMIRRINRRFKVATLVDTTNPGEIADAVLELHRDEELRESYGRNALEAVETEYSWDHMCDRLVRVYEQVLGCSPSRGVS